jgi:hypothetical protein
MISEVDRPVDTATSRLRASRASRNRRVASGIPIPLSTRVSAASAHSPGSANRQATTATASDSTTDWSPK